MNWHFDHTLTIVWSPMLVRVKFFRSQSWWVFEVASCEEGLMERIKICMSCGFGLMIM